MCQQVLIANLVEAHDESTYMDDAPKVCVK